MIRLQPARSPDRPLRLLLLGAHADDIEVGCGATLMRLAREAGGIEAHWVVFSAAEARAVEARASAQHFLAEARESHIEVHGFRDGYFPAEWGAIKDCFEALKRQGDPDIVFTHWTGDAHQDHRVIGELTWNTWRDHLILEYEVPKYDGDLGRPSVFVPVDRADAEAKVDALLRHFPSQRDRAWFTRDTLLSLMRLRAVEAQCSGEYAEAFHARKIVL